MDATSNDLRSPYTVSLCTLTHIYARDRIAQSILMVSGNHLLLQNEEATQYSATGPTLTGDGALYSGARLIIEDVYISPAQNLDFSLKASG